jgi:hypothetical protein
MASRRPASVVLVAALALLLAGCTVQFNPPAADDRGANSPSASSTPTPVVATGLVMDLDHIAVVNSDGTSGDSATLADGAATLSFLASHLGRLPEPTRYEVYGLLTYDWTGLSLTMPIAGGGAIVFMSTNELNGLTLGTIDGITIGSAQSEVEVAASPGTEYRSPDGVTVYFGLDARPHPGTESLAHPGQVGSDFVEVTVKSGVVTSLRNFGDWQDV